MHSSWTSEDGKYLYSCRETSNGNGDLRTYNIENPATPLLVNSVGMNALSINAVTPHNPVVMGNRLYISWYQAGIQVFDLSNPSTPLLCWRARRYTRRSSHLRQRRNKLSWMLSPGIWSAVRTRDRICCRRAMTVTGQSIRSLVPIESWREKSPANGLLVLDASAVTSPVKNRVSDFDGDGKTDLSVFSPSGTLWSIENSSDSTASAVGFGFGTMFWNRAIMTATARRTLRYFVLRRAPGGFAAAVIPGNFLAMKFGLSTDIPVAGDYDADGKTDLAVWRPSTGIWYIQQSTLGFKAMQWGVSGDKPVVGDFEGDGKIDIAVWRPSNGVWYVSQSSSSIPLYRAFGTNGDKPVSGDFDGNGVSDFTVYRPSNGTWYMLDPLHSDIFGL